MVIYYFVTKKSSIVPGDHGESGEAGDLGESGLSKGLRNDFRDKTLQNDLGLSTCLSNHKKTEKFMFPDETTMKTFNL